MARDKGARLVAAVHHMLSDGQWWTTSDLAVWTAGTDDVNACRMAAWAVRKLHGSGVLVEWRRATWVPSRRENAYRLVVDDEDRST